MYALHQYSVKSVWNFNERRERECPSNGLARKASLLNAPDCRAILDRPTPSAVAFDENDACIVLFYMRERLYYNCNDLCTYLLIDYGF